MTLKKRGAGNILLIVLAACLTAFIIHIAHALTLDKIIEYKEVSFHSGKISGGLDGYRIAFISDIHKLPEGSLREVVAKMNGKHADLLALGGDYSPNNTALTKTMEILSQIKAADGIYGVEGNHDRYRNLIGAMQKYSITPLFNSGVRVRDNLFIAGAEDLWKKNSNIALATEDAREGDFVLLLNHNPDAVMVQDTAGVDLILSGHTHGGQITFFGIWAPYFTFNDDITRYGQRFKSGWSKSRDGVPVYVGNGTGEYTLRVFARPQVVYITLRAAK